MELGLDEERAITCYLLGEMSAGELEAFEAAYFSDDTSVEKLEFVRDVLVDRYVVSGLSAAEREHFESHFLESPHHRRKLAFAAALIDAVDEPVPGDLQRPPSRMIVMSQTLKRRQGALALAAALLSLAIGSFFLLRGFLHLRQLPTDTANTNTNQMTPGAAGTPGPNLNQNRASDPRKSEEGRSVVASLVLTSRDRGSQGQSLVIGENTVSVHLHVARPEAGYTRYSASIRSVDDDRKIWSQELARSSGAMIVLKVPARLFDSQDYILSIRGATPGSEEIEGYSFRVEKR